MGHHGTACLGGGGRGAGGPVDGPPATAARARPAHLLRRGGAMSDDGASKTAIEGAGAGAHILLFEDDDTLAGLLAPRPRREGYQGDGLDNADPVPANSKLGRYDVVLSDVHLANDTNGHDVLKR